MNSSDVSPSEWDSLIGPEKRVYDAAKKKWEKPLPIQQESIPSALQGKDILAKARTGSGKTACYIIPILIGLLRAAEPLDFKALVLVPTKDLCKQVKQQFDDLGKYCRLTTAHLGDDDRVQNQKLKLKSNPPAILIGTPSRVYQLHSLDFFKKVQFFVVDEADQQLGLEHGPDIQDIIAQLPQTRQSFLMSATLDPEVEKLQKLVLNNPVFVDSSAKQEKTQLRHFYVDVTEDDRYIVLYWMIKCERLGKRVLIFVNSVMRGVKLKLFFERFTIKSSILMPNLPVESRSNILNSFNMGSIDILVAVDEGDESIQSEFSAARGVDFQNLHAVVNFDVPAKYEDYVHRVGRTARGTRTGVAMTFLGQGDDFFEIAGKLKENKVALEKYEVSQEAKDNFRYRVQSVLSQITKKQIKDAQKNLIKIEMLNSESLKAHFEENPRDLQIVKHDASLLPKMVDKGLRNIPDYLGASINRMAHPLTEKVRNSNKMKKRFGNFDSINESIKKYKKKHSAQKKKFEKKN